MSDLKLTRERMDDATNIIVQFLRDAGYAGSLEDGTGLNDIVVKPNALLRALMAQMADRAQAYQSLQKAYELRSEIGEAEFDSAVDCILSNWFVSRHDGAPSKGIIRLWFLQPPDFMQFREGQKIGSVDGTSIIADREQVFTQESFAAVLNTAENQNEYYVDVAVRTAANSTISPSETSNSKVSYTYNDIYYLRATIPADFSAGTLIESSDSFIQRTEQAITTRELITARAIRTVLLDNFSEIKNLYVARHGSSEQLRDIVHFEDVSVHVGNKADIYIASAPLRMRLNVAADENGFIDLAQLPVSTSIIAYLAAFDEAENRLEMDIGCEEAHWCSRNYKPAFLKVNGCGNISLDLLCDTTLGLVHDFVFSNAQRVACYDPLVKHKFPLLLYPVLNVRLIDKKIDSSPAIKAAVLEYINYAVSHNQSWIASELMATVHVRVPNVNKISLPLECAGIIYDPLTQKTQKLEIGNTFNIDDDFTLPHSRQITNNTVQLYSDKNMITINAD